MAENGISPGQHLGARSGGPDSTISPGILEANGTGDETVTNTTITIQEASSNTTASVLDVQSFHGQVEGEILEAPPSLLGTNPQVIALADSATATAAVVTVAPEQATDDPVHNAFEQQVQETMGTMKASQEAAEAGAEVFDGITNNTNVDIEEASSAQGRPLELTNAQQFPIEQETAQQMPEEYEMISTTDNQEAVQKTLDIGAPMQVNETIDESQQTAPLQPGGQASARTSQIDAAASKQKSPPPNISPALPREKKKKTNPEKSKSNSSKRKRATKGKNESKKAKGNSDADSDSDDYMSDTEETNREFSRPSRRSLKNSPEFARAYSVYSKAFQEKKSAETQFEKISRQYEAARQRKALAEQTLASAKEALYEADLQVSCYWNTMYHKLVKYKETHGHCMVPYTRGVVTDAEEKKLGAWVHCQRKNYHNYKKGLNQAKQQLDSQSPAPTGSQGNNRMKPQRIVALEKLGFVWSFFDTKWSQRIKDLLGYKEQHGHLNVPFKYPPNQSLAHWVHNQRRDYNLFQEGKPSQMTVEKINELESLGFAWKSDYPRTKRKLTPEPVSLSEAELWEENYRALATFRAEYGHCSVNRFTSPNRKLCAWLTWQRKQHKLFMSGQPSQLNSERIKKLTDLGFEWTPRNKPGSGGLIPNPTMILPITNVTANNIIQHSTTMSIPMEIGAKSDAGKMEVVVAPTPQYENDMKIQYQQGEKGQVLDDQAPDPLNQHQHIQLLHPVEDDEVALMAQI